MHARHLFPLLLAVSVTAPAGATPLEDRLREQLQSTTTQLRELQTKQAGLEAAKASAEKERDLAKAKGSAAPAADVSRELAAARSQNAAISARASTAASALAAANSRNAELTSQLGTARAELGQLRAAAATSGTSLTASATALQDCTDRNGRLVAAGREMARLHAKRYGGGDFPLFQVQRTRIENEAQAMSDKINADVIVVNADPTAPK